MKRSAVLSLILAVCLLIAACSLNPTETQPPDAGTSVPIPTESTAPTEPSTQPTETQPVVTEPPIVLEAGPTVYINGIQADDTVIQDNILYISTEMFCKALGGDAADGESTVTHNGTNYTFSKAYTHILVNGKAQIPQNAILNYQDKAYLALEEFCPEFQLAVLHDPEVNAVYCTASAWPREVAAGRDVPVFMYHAVDNNLWGIAELFVKPEMMEEHLKYLTENGYDPIFFEDLYHIEDYDKPVILTFDDGYMDNYTQLFPLLKKYNCKATVFIIDSMIDVDSKYLTTDQIVEMADSGLVSIQSHTVSHPNLDTLILEEQRIELEDSRLLTARLSKRIPSVLCYPSGRYDQNTLSIIDEYYHFGIKMNGGLYETGDNPYQINRYYVARSDSLYWFTSTLEGIFD